MYEGEGWRTGNKKIEGMWEGKVEARGAERCPQSSRAHSTALSAALDPGGDQRKADEKEFQGKTILRRFLAMQTPALKLQRKLPVGCTCFCPLHRFYAEQVTRRRMSLPIWFIL